MPKVSRVQMYNYRRQAQLCLVDFGLRTQLLTSFVTNALAPSSKVQCLTYCQLSLVQVVLVDIGRSVDCLELIELLAIVCDITTQLQYKQAKCVDQSSINSPVARCKYSIKDQGPTCRRRCWPVHC